MKGLEGLRAAGATVVFDDSILGDNFAVVAARVGTAPYKREGTEKYLAEFGPSQYRSPGEYQRVVGSPLPATIIGGVNPNAPKEKPVLQAVFEKDRQAQGNVIGPRQKALDIYNETLDRLKLDGYVYPATQMPRPMRRCRKTARSARPAQRDGMGQHDRCAGCSRARRILSERTAIRPGNLSPGVEGWRPNRLGVRV